MNIKVGDKVRLKDKFYDEPDFKTENRFARKEISKNKGFEIMVHKIISEGMRVSSDENKGAFTIPISLLEKVEEPVVQEENTIDGQVHNYNSKQQDAAQRKFEKWLKTILDRNPQNFRKWTKEEVTEAKCLIADFMIRLNGNGYSVVITYLSTIRTDARIAQGTFVRTASARCSKKDEYNPYIGTMVALCKVTNLAMPDWVNNH